MGAAGLGAPNTFIFERAEGADMLERGDSSSNFNSYHQAGTRILTLRMHCSHMRVRSVSAGGRGVC